MNVRFVAPQMVTLLAVATITASAAPLVGRSIWVDKSRQRVYVFSDDHLFLRALCSTAGSHAHWSPLEQRYLIPRTPTGKYRIFSKEADHWSKTYEVHMRYALFFDGGRALHATYRNEYRRLGRPASGGCVRLTRSTAERLFRWARVGDEVHVVRSLPPVLLAMVGEEHHLLAARRGPGAPKPGSGAIKAAAKKPRIVVTPTPTVTYTLPAEPPSPGPDTTPKPVPPLAAPPPGPPANPTKPTPAPSSQPPAPSSQPPAKPEPPAKAPAAAPVIP